MRGGFLAVPRAGLDLARDDGERAAWLWLCEQADMWGWGQSFEARDADLATAAGKSRGPWPSRYLDRMQRAGLLKIERAGHRRLSRLVSVCSPFGSNDGQQAGSNAESSSSSKKDEGKTGNAGATKQETKQETKQSDSKGDGPSKVDRERQHTESDTEARGARVRVPASWDDPDMPRWLRVWRRDAKLKPPKRYGIDDVFAALSRCLEAVKCVLKQPTKTDALKVLGLWEYLEYPELDEFVSAFVLVAEAAHEAPAPVFARHIRAEGWPDGEDRQFKVATIARQDRWDERVEAARRWHEAGRPVSTGPAPQQRQASDAGGGWGRYLADDDTIDADFREA